MPSEVMKQISLEEEYGKNTGVTPQDIAKLRDWLKTQPHLPEKYISDMDLILAYHSCNGSTGLTKQVIDMNFTLRSLLNAFKDRKVDPHMLKFASYILITPLSMRTNKGYKIFFTHLINSDVKIFNFGDCVKSAIMMFEMCQYEEGTWPGLIIIFDFNSVSLGHIAKIDLINLQQFLYYLQEGLFVKLKGMHFINAPSFIDKLLMMIKPFLNKELMDTLYVHSSGSKNVEEYFPMEALPKECGGNSKSIDEHKDYVISKMKAYKEVFEQDTHKKVTESLRPGKPKTITDIFGGVEGSFKKLDID